MQFREWKVFWLKFRWSFSLGSNGQQPSIDSEKGLAPNRGQALIWTNADPIRCIHAALGEDALNNVLLASFSGHMGQIHALEID